MSGQKTPQKQQGIPKDEDENSKYIDTKTLKQLNVKLAASAQQGLRDQGLIELSNLLVKKQMWFDNSINDQNETPKKKKLSPRIKSLRMVWEGLFFMIWHSDKPHYQKECCEKISEIISGLNNTTKKQEWFEQFLYIFNLHWNKVDNFRIDKFLMFIRLQFYQLILFLKDVRDISNKNEKQKNEYNNLIDWYKKSILKFFLRSQADGSDTATGIPLQISDIIICEINKVDSEASLEAISDLIDPFLKALGQLSNGELKDRIVDKIFKPILESNKTESELSDDEEKFAKQEHYHRFIDGGKLPPKTQKEIKQIINKKYVFSGFNILIYARNYIFKLASNPDTQIVKEENRDGLYKLYEYALQLEPKPEREELTFAQQQLVNRARQFVTLKMKKRLNVRETKKESKNLIKVKKILSNQLQEKFEELDKQKDSDMEESKLDKENNSNIEEEKFIQKQNFVEEKKQDDQLIKKKKKIEKKISDSESDEEIDLIANIIQNKKDEQKQKDKKIQKKQEEEDSDQNEDQVIEIKKKKKKNDKKRRKNENSEKVEQEVQKTENKRVRFDLSQNKVTEFFKHGKVAQRVLVKQ